VLQTPPRDPQKRTSAVPRQEGGPGLTISTSSLLHQHTCMRLQGEGHTMHHSIHQTRKATHHKQGISGPCPPFHWPLLLPLSCPLALFVGPFPFHLPFHLQAPLALPSSCPQPPPPQPVSTNPHATLRPSVQTLQINCLWYPGLHVVFAVPAKKALHKPCCLAVSSQITQALSL
jgi:hypothetical protein